MAKKIRKIAPSARVQGPLEKLQAIRPKLPGGEVQKILQKQAKARKK